MSNYLEFSDPGNGISFEYPDFWVYQQEQSVGVTIFGRKETLESLGSNPTDPVFNVVSTKLPKTFTPEAFIQSQLEQMSYMSPSSPLKVEDIVLSNVPAKKIIANIQHDSSKMKLFAILTTYSGTGYSFLFHCKSSVYKDYLPVLSNIVTTIRFSKYASKSLVLVPIVVEKANLLIRYPQGYGIDRKAGDDNSKPEITFTELSDDGECKTEIKVVIQQRKGSLDHHVDMMKENLEKMLVDEVDVINSNIGTKSSVSFLWRSDAKIKNGYFAHTITSESDSSPIIAISASSNFIESESRISEILKAVRNSIRFLSDSDLDMSKSKWNTLIALNHNIGFHFNPQDFVFENVPLTEGSFVMKEDENSENPRCSFSLLSKEVEQPTVSASLSNIEEELNRNCNDLCNNQVEVIKKQKIEMLGGEGRLNIFKGEIFNPNANGKETLIFLYQFTVIKGKKSILFAFSSTPSLWESEWQKASKSINSIFLC